MGDAISHRVAYSLSVMQHYVISVEQLNGDCGVDTEFKDLARTRPTCFLDR